MSSEQQAVTGLLRELRSGNKKAFDEPDPLVYGPLRKIAARCLDLLELDQALDKLALLDARKCEIIELLFFGGLTYDESAAALNISPATL